MSLALTIVLSVLLPASRAAVAVETRLQGYCVYCW